jgi:histidinol phosphatase-like enzyme (inositol monophosphatase family)
MSTTIPSVRDLLAVAMRVARVGGQQALAYFNRGPAVEWKADQTPVTLADREAESAMRTVIARAFPDHSILGEEAGETRGGAPHRWIIDPIDGTRTFVRGVPLFGSLVAVEGPDGPIVGVIYLPALDEMVAAARGEGCTWNGQACRVSTADRLENALVTLTDDRMARARSTGYQRLALGAQLLRTWGDCYGYALVATGRAEVALDVGMQIWDCAALLPIIEEAGGRFTDWSGQRTISGGDAVATNGALHGQVLALLGGG